MFQPLILDIYFVIGQKCFKTGIVYFGSGTGQFIFGGVIWWIIMATRVNFTNKDGRCIPISMGKKWTDHGKWMQMDGCGQSLDGKSVAMGIFMNQFKKRMVGLAKKIGHAASLWLWGSSESRGGGAGRPKNVRNDEQTMKTIENSEIEEAFARDFCVLCFVSFHDSVIGWDPRGESTHFKHFWI